MSSYYFCKAGQRLRNELNAANPKRDKRSDGWIGDASHQARKSDHNPDYAHGGVVLAFDIDNDGVDVDRLIALLIKDYRVNYVIWNRHIWSRQHGFVKRAYTGTSPHTEHVHVSFLLAHCNDGGSFGYYKAQTAPKAVARPVAAKPVAAKPTRRAQIKTNAQLADEVIDGKWGTGTDRIKRLTQAGYNAKAVQAEVNKKL